ncbi:Helicase associated domain protein [Kitasatospora sp. NPDC127060]|uniref:DEAD/DEAH box helicase n=1 Tax=Kitasatospora sp. NPDC127060 TaxID=3347121 RepID=UPI003659229E
MNEQERPYQTEAVAALVAGLRESPLGQLHAACGSGKTLMSQRATERLLPAGGTVAVLTPSLALIAQTLSSWQRNAASPIRAALAVCFDDTVADAPARLPDLRIPVTTDPAAITAWLTEPADGLRLIVGTYASAERLAEAVRATAPLDLLILDEAHHLAGRPAATTRRVVDRAFLPAGRRLYMTATPRINRSGAERHGHLSMDDPDVFGPVLYSYSFARGIAEGYLEDYRLVVVGISDREARSLLADEQREYVEEIGAPSLQTLVAQAALIKANSLHRARRVLTFHHRVDQAADFARTLPRTAARLGTLIPTSSHVHGEMSHNVRDRVLDHLLHPPEGGWTVVSNARCLGEGVDVPAVDAILFAHPKRSAVDIVQAVGRALRPHADTAGPSTIIVPLVLPEEDGEVGDLDPGDYEVLWQVVRALRAHDDPLGMDLDVQRSHGHVDNPGLPEKITVVLPQGTAQRILDTLTTMLVRQTTSPWWEGYGHAATFYATHGHLRVPTDYLTPDGYRLWRWMQDALKHRRRGWLSADRVEALDKLGMVWERHQQAWENAYQAAVDYHAAKGSLRIPQGYTESSGFQLGRWINRQRAQYRAGRLSSDRAERLTQLGMVWNVLDADWQNCLAAARAYREQQGHLDVPEDYTAPDGTPLGQTLSHLRASRRKGTIAAERAAVLDELGMIWAPKQERAATEWDRFIRAARRHLARPGVRNLQLPRGWRDPEDGYPLASKLATYRQRAADLTDEQRALLSELAPTRTAATAQSDAAAAMRRFHAEYGHLRIPATYRTADGTLLYPVLDRLRGWHRNGTLLPGVQRELEELGLSLQRSDPWPDFLDALRRWYADHEPGQLPPRGYTDPSGYPLAQRLEYHRHRAGTGQLPTERIEQLLALGAPMPRRRTNAPGGASHDEITRSGAMRTRKAATEAPSAVTGKDHRGGSWA